MSIFFDQVDVAINQSGIIATHASVESANSVEAAFLLGNINQFNQTNFGPIKTNFKFDYIPEVNYEPNFSIVSKIKSLISDTGYHGEKVEVAGITQDYCFLEDYSLKSQPNNIVQASVSYVTFFPPCGTIKNKNNRINYFNDGSMAHAWSSYVVNTGDYLSFPVYNLEYQIKFNWTPIYIIGRKYPISIRFINAVETIGFSIDNYRNILITGENLLNNVIIDDSTQKIKLGNIALSCDNNCLNTGILSLDTLNINIEKFKINNISVDAALSEAVRTTYSCSRYY